MHYLSLGDTTEIAASCHYVNLAGTGVVLDAGMDPDKDGYAALPPFELIKDRAVDHVVVTHAHHDHMGALPVLAMEVPHATIHLSRATARIADILLPSSARLQRRRLREKQTTEAPVFDVEAAEGLSFLYEPHLLDTDLDWTGERATSPLTARFYHAGHILGAVGVYLEAEEDGKKRRIFYTGDTSLQPQTLLHGADYPDPPLDVLLLESTLGANPEAELKTRKAEERRFGETLKTVLGRGGVALVPVFALGRSQDMLAIIQRAKRRGVIPDDTPVYTAGSMRAIAGVYDDTRFSTPRLDPDFEVWNVEQQRLPKSGKRLSEALSEPGIFLISSGMLFEKTPSFKIAQRIISEEKHAVLFVGFCKEDSPGHLLQEAARNGSDIIQLSPELGPQRLNATIDRFRFSGHADRRDLLKIVEQTQPETIILVHGETAAKQWMKDNIGFHFPDVKVIVPEMGKAIEV